MNCPKCAHPNADTALCCDLCTAVLRREAAERPAAAAPPPVSRSSGPVTFRTTYFRLKMPDHCACCLAVAEDEITVQGGGGSGSGADGDVMVSIALDIPYCISCARHVRGFRRMWGAVAIAAALPYGGITGYALFSGEGFGAVATAVYVIAGFLTPILGMVAGLLFNAFAAPAGPRCSSRGAAVEVRMENLDSIFTFTNGAFGQRVREINLAP